MTQRPTSKVDTAVSVAGRGSMDAWDTPKKNVRPTRQVTVVLNPASGRGEGRKCRAQLEAALANAVNRTEQRPTTWKIVETAKSGDGTVLAREAAEQGAEVVAAAGGDGTLGEVLNGLAGSTAHLGLIPLGTGNDFARQVGIPRNLSSAVDILMCGVPQPVDLGRTHDRWFINVAGCGFDAVVAQRVNSGFRFLKGTNAYIAAVLHSLMHFKPVSMRLTIDGEVHTLRAMLCAVANAGFYGGGMHIAPDAQINDGLFDLCLLQEAGTLEFLRAFPQVFRGTHVTHPKVTMLRGKHILIETDPPTPLLVDGDLCGVTPVEFLLYPSAIHVLGPYPPAPFPAGKG